VHFRRRKNYSSSGASVPQDHLCQILKTGLRPGAQTFHLFIMFIICKKIN
jgi:hypothetical protein